MEFCVLALLMLSSSFYVFASASKEECLLPSDPGPCRALLPRYFYNTITQKCDKFFYGGCLGNANNYRSPEECKKACFRTPKIPQICRLPKDEGPCRAMFNSYFFNVNTMQCELFHYGGCHGNANRFPDAKSCTEYCNSQTTLPVLCRDPLDIGMCRASIPRYYYNTASKMCEQFNYSGCGGSNNNFVSRESCMDVCGEGKKKSKAKRVRKRKNTSNRITFLQA
ncbi:tissue factor pathway inhibitor 2 [Antennarius striatus]|uniref:tissue factor pathway inhibitor 2 n=1 Tax=Antennarius striatus TaxID=241820 RepID=UPI0035B1554C